MWSIFDVCVVVEEACVLFEMRSSGCWMVVEMASSCEMKLKVEDTVRRPRWAAHTPDEADWGRGAVVAENSGW